MNRQSPIRCSKHAKSQLVGSYYAVEYGLDSVVMPSCETVGGKTNEPETRGLLPNVGLNDDGRTYAVFMHLRVLFFSVLQDRFGIEERLEQFPGKSVSDLLQYYRVIAPELGSMWDVIAVAVNQQYAHGATVLTDGDEVALLPPVSGGTPGEDGQSQSGMRVRLVRERIDTQAITDAIKAGEDGAVTVFDGIVRNNTRGRQTLYLDYTAYEGMALEQMQALADEAKQRFGVREVAMVHRLGRLEIGETSILIAVASAHRGVTFDACRWLIDTLKKQVPIWKQEVFVDGAVWVPGEPFPAAMKPIDDAAAESV